MSKRKTKTEIRTKTKKNNNAGFSLVEVVIAMAMLAILSIPLLSYFSDSMKYNAKMEQKQKATLLAQTVLEQLNQESSLVTKTTDASGTTVIDVPSLTQKGYVLSGAWTDGVGTYYGSASVLGGNFDVLVKVDASTASVSENGVATPSVSALDGDHDVLMAESSETSEALVYFMALNQAYTDSLPPEATETSMTENQILAKMTHTINVTIETDGGSDTVTVQSVYTADEICGENNPQTYECTAKQTRVAAVQRIFLLYEATMKKECVKVSREAGTTATPELCIICQNLDDDTALPGGHTLELSSKYVPTVSTNLNASYSTKGWALVDNTNTIVSSNKLVESEMKIRRVNLTVSVYKQGETGTGEPYITVTSSKGE